MLELSTLLGSFTQATRLLRLSTALAPDVLLAECVRGEEAICSVVGCLHFATSLAGGTAAACRPAGADRA